MNLGQKLSVGGNKKNSKWMSVLQRRAPRYAQAVFKIASLGTVTSAVWPHVQIFIWHLRERSLRSAENSTWLLITLLGVKSELV